MQTWAESRKSDAPSITDSMRVFIVASKETEATYVAKSKATQQQAAHAWKILAVVVAVFALVIAAGIAAWWNQDWLKERAYALGNVTSLTVAQERAFKPKDSFRECTDCPEMVVVPAGNYVMGSPDGEKESLR